jgi:hypothetical protein
VACLDRDGAIQPRIARLPNLSHAAITERASDLVGPRRVPGARAIDFNRLYLAE